ncbi:heavy metal translocating P-type ATPase, partial [Sulfitobacter mediterraneus]|uniref:heavy metal translocating P-type ATPase n=1 Tax=Sulfitobacter mediterraneus TaxID=83219 RepID=UPI0024912AEC
MTQNSQVTLSIEGMTCASCVGRVEKSLSALEGISDVSVNLASESARVSVDDPARLQEAAQALDTLGYPARTSRVTLNIASMSCASCVGQVDKALADVPGVLSVTVNLAAETAVVEFLEGAVATADLMAATAAIGYPAEVAEANASQSRVERKAEEADNLLRNVLLAAALTLPVFVLEMGAHLIPAFHMAIANSIGTQTSWVIQFVLATIVLFGPGRHFFLKGIPALLRGAPDMNSLVAVGTGAAWSYSIVATFLPGLLPEGVRAVYFEAAAVIVVLILIGRWLEARAKGRTGAAIQSLLGLQVRTARVLRDEETVEVDVDALG